MKQTETLKALWSRWKYAALIAAAGAALLAAVLLIPALEPLFSAAALPAADLGAVAGLAFGSMAVIQALKALRRK